MKKPVYNASHPVAVVVEPLRNAAMDKAEQFCREWVAKMLAELAAKNWDLNEVAPYPNSWGMGRIEYKAKTQRYYAFRRITQGTAKHSRSPNSPEPCEANAEGIAKLVADTRENASLQYDAFICKMISKIGDCEAAELSGSHVWGYSFLRITKAEGVETWKTQQIVNFSKLGTVFNQWPSRKVK